MNEVTALRKRAEAVGCRVRVFRRNYHCNGKPVRYALIYDLFNQYEYWAADVNELRDLVRRREKAAA
jgi:hypothetical protein